MPDRRPLRRPACAHRTVHTARLCRVEQCEHGTVHLVLGDLTLRLAPDDFRELAAALAAAAAEVAGPPPTDRLLC